jgi:hypothetical protein
MRQPLASGDLWKDDDDVFVRPDRFFFGKRERERLGGEGASVIQDVRCLDNE